MGGVGGGAVSFKHINNFFWPPNIVAHLGDPPSVNDLSVEHGEHNLPPPEDDRPDTIHALKEREVSSCVEAVVIGAVNEAGGEEEGPEDKDGKANPEGNPDPPEREVVVGVPAGGGSLVGSNGVGTLGVNKGEERPEDEEEGIDLWWLGGVGSGVRGKGVGDKDRDNKTQFLTHWQTPLSMVSSPAMITETTQEIKAIVAPSCEKRRGGRSEGRNKVSLA